MRVPWWRSIRWRLAIGSILVSLLATTLLAITVLIAINYYYGVDLRQRLTTFATDTAGRVQPFVPAWNPSGYLWNGIDRIGVTVEAKA